METSDYISVIVPILNEHSRTQQSFFYLCEVKRIPWLKQRLNK